MYGDLDRHEPARGHAELGLLCRPEPPILSRRRPCCWRGVGAPSPSWRRDVEVTCCAGLAFASDQFVAEFPERLTFAPGLEFPELPAVGGFCAPGVGGRAGWRGEGSPPASLMRPSSRTIPWCSVPRWIATSVSPAFSSPAAMSRGMSIP